MDYIKSIIAKNITELRTSKGMTQLELANMLNYSDKAVSKWERGESVPEIGTLTAVADLFEVPLDYLVRAEHKEKAAPIDAAEHKKRIINRSIVTSISIVSVWFIALLIYILIDIISKNVEKHWITFLYAMPVSVIVWLVFNSIWFNRRRNYLIISILMWSILIAFHLTFLPFGINIWQLYLLGIPAQLVILMWSKLFVRTTEEKQEQE